MATNRGKIHGGKSVLNVQVASGEFGEIKRGETTRFYCILMHKFQYQTKFKKLILTWQWPPYQQFVSYFRCWH